LSAHPRVLAVVSSRSYGKGRPSTAERFETLDIQPLSNGEIAAFSATFFAKVQGADAVAAAEDQQRFQAALERSPDAQALARTPLLLTMMLLISRDRPLPDKRHILYEECIKNLLNARPGQREKEGAQLTEDQWRPPDAEERLRVVAAMAFGMQDHGYKRVGRAPIVRTRDELCELLPTDWSREKRHGFLAWLTGAAGVMVDRADGTLAFAHLSFQEYLAAWHLYAEKEGVDERTRVCQERARDVDWWETLRLWAALVQGKSAGHLQPVLDALRERNAEGFWLAGAMHADGLGDEQAFQRWIEGLTRRFGGGEDLWSATCARAWAASRQDERREVIGPALGRGAYRSTWVWSLRAQRWSDAARLATAPALRPPPGSMARGVLDSLEDTLDARTTALGRVF